MRKIYLAGTIQADPINATDWREYLIKELSQIGWTGIVPPGMLVQDLEEQQDTFRGWIRAGKWDLFLPEFKKIRERDIDALKSCQAIVMYLPELLWSWGTKGEIYYAYNSMNIPLYLVYPLPISTCSFWLISVIRGEKRGEIFRTFPEFVRCLKEKKDEVQKPKS